MWRVPWENPLSVTEHRLDIKDSLTNQQAMEASSWPKDLAELVVNELRREAKAPPDIFVITNLLEILYFSSFKTEESQPIVCTVTYIDPAISVSKKLFEAFRIPRPKAKVVKSPFEPACTYLTFDEHIPLSVDSLVKLSRAVDPHTSSLAVYIDSAKNLFIWGLIDQVALHSTRYMGWESDVAPEIPGDFQVQTVGVADLAVYAGYHFLGGLKQNMLVRSYADVQWGWPGTWQVNGVFLQSPL
jgi:hypothetical protein